jgi:hypothetical protein
VLSRVPVIGGACARFTRPEECRRLVYTKKSVRIHSHLKDYCADIQSSMRMAPPDNTRPMTLPGTLCVFRCSTALSVPVRPCRSRPCLIAFETSCAAGCASASKLARRSACVVFIFARYVFENSSSAKQMVESRRRKNARRRCVYGHKVEHLKRRLTLDSEYYSSMTKSKIIV